MGQYLRLIELALVAMGIGTAYFLYGGLIHWWPFGTLPEFPSYPYLIVYAASVGLAYTLDFFAHPHRPINVPYRESRRR